MEVVYRRVSLSVRDSEKEEVEGDIEKCGSLFSASPFPLFFISVSVRTFPRN